MRNYYIILMLAFGLCCTMGGAAKAQEAYSRSATGSARTTSAKANAPKDELRLHSGYRGIFEVGGGPGVGYYGDELFVVSTSHGYQIGRYLFVGAGAALARLNMYQTAMYDFFVDLRGYLNNAQWTPYSGLKIGYSPFTTRNNGPYKRFATGDCTRQHGIFVSPSLGVTVALTPKVGIFFSVSDNIQLGRFYSDPDLTITPNNAQTAATDAHFVNSLSFSVGVYW